MALIRGGNATTVAKPVRLNLGDLSGRAEAMRRAAEAEAAKILADAHAERDRLIKGAEEKGYADGLARGLEDGRKQGMQEGREEAIAAAAAECNELSNAWAEALATLNDERDNMQRQARHDIVKLAVMLAERVTKRVVDIDHQVASVQVAAALAVVSSSGRIEVCVSRVDFDVVQAVLPELCAQAGRSDHAELIEDETLDRGSCIVRTADGGEIIADIASQFDRLVQDLLPDAPTATDVSQTPDQTDATEASEHDVGGAHEAAGDATGNSAEDDKPGLAA
ncbi:MAG: FliH/SctL family protein [Planctomycetota bacterium]